MVTAEPVFSTTIVFGLAAATAEISEFSELDRSMLDRSLPSVSKLLANTTATLEDAASAAAELVDEPSLKLTLIPLPARAVMPCSGVTVPLELTEAEPPPAVSGLADASAPMTAIDEVLAELSGRMLPLFLSSTVPSSASWVASDWSAALVAVCAGEPVGGLSNSPYANISVSTLETRELSVAMDTDPEETADCQRTAVEAVIAGHVHVQPGVRRSGGRVRPAPVRGHEAGEADLLAQHGGEQERVLAGERAVDRAVGAHH